MRGRAARSSSQSTAGNAGADGLALGACVATHEDARATRFAPVLGDRRRPFEISLERVVDPVDFDRQAIERLAIGEAHRATDLVRRREELLALSENGDLLRRAFLPGRVPRLADLVGHVLQTLLDEAFAVSVEDLLALAEQVTLVVPTLALVANPLVLVELQRAVGRRVERVALLLVGPHVAHESQHRVVVRLADRVELVVVTAGAAHGDAHHPLADRAEDVVPAVVVRGDAVVRFGVPGSELIEAGGDQGVVRRWAQFVTGNLFGEEAIVGLVLVERADHVVAVAPDVRLLVVLLVPVGLGEAHDVEPVAAPSLAVLGAREQRVDEAIPLVGSVVGDVGLQLLVARWQAQ